MNARLINSYRLLKKHAPQLHTYLGKFLKTTVPGSFHSYNINLAPISKNSVCQYTRRRLNSNGHNAIARSHRPIHALIKPKDHRGKDHGRFENRCMHASDPLSPLHLIHPSTQLTEYQVDEILRDRGYLSGNDFLITLGNNKHID